MTERYEEQGNGFKVYITIIGGNQAYITASVTLPHRTAEIAAGIYQTIYSVLEKYRLQIVHERIFGDLSSYEQIIEARNRAFARFGESLPFTYIQGKPVIDSGLAGVQIRAFRPERPDDGIWVIRYDGRAVGRKWRRSGAEFLMLQNIYGNPQIADRYHQACDMFDQAQAVLQSEGLSFKNVLRTWIYLSKILEWYGEFNRARNARFTEYGLLGLSEKENTEAERIYLPASTGILGENPAGAAGAMDAFAVRPGGAGLQISHTTGVQQKSPYRYGSAFSRAMTLREPDVKHILLSGTASIDEHGKTVFIGDVEAQIRKTFSVVEALIRHEGASLHDVHEATVFFKCPQDFRYFPKIAREFGVADLPAVYIVADVCRDDLLFELDAAIAV
ncbi:MAG: Rid family hydrolase [candidate division KSB1 bacterium]|nr:Rid family hydrolase [candidate division KSB1 bacterium]